MSRIEFKAKADPRLRDSADLPSASGERLADALGRHIVLDLSPVGPLVPTEIELGRRFGAGRTLVREAVKQLAAMGLVSVSPRSGTRIRPEAEWRLLDPKVLDWLILRDAPDRLLVEFLQLRLGIEPAAAALAARHASDKSRAAIQRALHDMQVAESTPAQHLRTDIAFHLTILNATGNRFFAQLGVVTKAALELSITVAHDLRLPATSYEDHRRIAEAILAGDTLEAAEAMTSHLRRAYHRIVDQQDLKAVAA